MAGNDSLPRANWSADEVGHERLFDRDHRREGQAQQQQGGSAVRNSHRNGFGRSRKRPAIRPAGSSRVLRGESPGHGRHIKAVSADKAGAKDGDGTVDAWGAGLCGYRRGNQLEGESANRPEAVNRRAGVKAPRSGEGCRGACGYGREGAAAGTWNVCVNPARHGGGRGGGGRVEGKRPGEPNVSCDWHGLDCSS